MMRFIYFILFLFFCTNNTSCLTGMKEIWGFLIIVHRGSEAAHFVVAGRP